jgi:hypothetical protein
MFTNRRSPTSYTNMGAKPPSAQSCYKFTVFLYFESSTQISEAPQFRQTWGRSPHHPRISPNPPKALDTAFFFSRAAADSSDTFLLYK